MLAPNVVPCFVTVIVVADLFIISPSYGQESEFAMLSKILKEYPKPLREGHARPVKQYSQKMQIAVELLPQHLSQLDDVHETISILATLKLRWMDPYLAWKDTNNGTYNYISVVAIEHGQAWTPTIIHSNNVANQDIVSHFGRNCNLFVDQDGRVTWQPTGIFTSTCDLKLWNFPFDRQECEMVFEPWPMSDLAGNADIGMVVLGEVGIQSISSSDFIFKGSMWTLEDFVYLQSDNKAIYKMILRRSYQYTLYNVIIPCILLSLLQLASFGIRADVPERPTFSVTVLLAFGIYQIMIKEDIPETSNLVLLLLYVIIQFTLGTVSTIHAGVLSYLITRRALKVRQENKKMGIADTVKQPTGGWDEIPSSFLLADKFAFLAILIACVSSHVIIFAMITSF